MLILIDIPHTKRYCEEKIKTLYIMGKELNLSGLTTEQNSNHNNLEEMSIEMLIKNINAEDKSVPIAVYKARKQIASLIKKAIETIKNNGRIFYIGAGTSGRLGVVDASECPPTFGVDFDTVIGIIAGGDGAIRKAVEGAEDNTEQAFRDLEEFKISENDFVIGIAASGRTPYVVGGLKECKNKNIPTGCIVCNLNSPIKEQSDFPIEVIVGPEFLTGSSRMKAGTAQKLVLNMISTSVFIKTGKVKGNKMIHMRMSNEKLIERGTRMVMEKYQINHCEAEKMLKEKSLNELLA